MKRKRKTQKEKMILRTKQIHKRTLKRDTWTNGDKLQITFWNRYNPVILNSFCANIIMVVNPEICIYLLAHVSTLLLLLLLLASSRMQTPLLFVEFKSDGL